ncbi:MAG: LysM peptidoglycan-binding domain-containing M23 family metallopeptidase [Devosia sp.]
MLAWDQHRKWRPVELGDEPPLVVGDGDPSRYTRRGVSVRWLFGAVVTAITSVALMGGALVAALDGRYVIEAQAAVFDAPLSRGVEPAARKGDRMLPAHETVSSRKIIEVSTVVRQGDGDLIAKRPYALVNASLVLDKAEIGDIPKFNARAYTKRDDPTTGATDAIYDKSVDGEITVSVSEFPLEGDVIFDDDIVLDEAEVERQLRDDQYVPRPLALAEETETLVGVPEGAPANVIVVPENVSELIKTSEGEIGTEANTDLIELVQPGDTLSKILLGSGIAADDIKAIDGVLSRLGVATLRPGQVLTIAFQLDETEGEEARRRPGRFSIYSDDQHVATVAMTDDGRFVLGEAPPGPPPVVDDVQVASSKEQLPSIYRSLYQTALNHDLPEAVRHSLLGTFSLDVDFNARVRPGDRLTVLHSAVEESEGPPEILYASLTAAGVERRFYRFRATDGSTDYYDEDGRTGDKFLLRKPMARGVFRSGFGMRRHPILRRRRMHKGVDWAAPRGTPIYAAGDGVVKQAGWRAGYGRWVSLRHKNGYETGYAHQSRIAKGIRPGVRVKQGQVIGYVGSTGFSTGPHLHYEVRVNGRHVNPLKIRLRRGRELSGDALVAFKSERDRINALIEEQTVAIARR